MPAALEQLMCDRPPRPVYAENTVPLDPRDRPPRPAENIKLLRRCSAKCDFGVSFDNRYEILPMKVTRCARTLTRGEKGLEEENEMKDAVPNTTPADLYVLN